MASSAETLHVSEQSKVVPGETENISNNTNIPVRSEGPLPTSPFPGLVCVPTNQPFFTAVESIQNAASGASRWHGQERQPPYYARKTEKSSTIIEYGRDAEQQVFEDRAILNLWKDVHAFSDRDADLLLYAFSAIIKETNGQGGVWIWAQSFLDQRGVKPMSRTVEGTGRRRAGHRTEDVADIDASLYRLSGLWITIEEVLPPRKKSGKPRVYRHQGRVLTVMETWTQHTLHVSSEREERVPLAWKIRAGDWLLEYLHAPRYVAFLCEQSLHYDPENEKWEKRLSRYLLFFLRMNSRHSNSVLVRSVEELFQANSLPLDRESPQRSRHRLEKALDRLLADQQMEQWEYVPESITALPAKRWLQSWLHWRVRLLVKARPMLPK
jgi:hypothetical protein